MKILFLAEPYMNLHQPIIRELKEQGNEVVFLEDKHLDFDWKEGWRGKRNRYIRRIKASLNRHFQKYWSDRLQIDNNLNTSFDILLVINGCSFHPYLLNKLREKSSNIKTVLYLWDNSSFYNYFHNAKYFDRVLTFDMVDSKKYGVDLLPFYFTKEMPPPTIFGFYSRLKP